MHCLCVWEPIVHGRRHIWLSWKRYSQCADFKITHILKKTCSILLTEFTVLLHKMYPNATDFPKSSYMDTVPHFASLKRLSSGCKNLRQGAQLFHFQLSAHLGNSKIRHPTLTDRTRLRLRYCSYCVNEHFCRSNDILWRQKFIKLFETNSDAHIWGKSIKMNARLHKLNAKLIWCINFHIVMSLGKQVRFSG